MSIWSNNWNDPDSNVANERASNRWSDDTWGWACKDRIFTPSLIELLDLETGLAELDRCIAAEARWSP